MVFNDWTVTIGGNLKKCHAFRMPRMAWGGGKESKKNLRSNNKTSPSHLGKKMGWGGVGDTGNENY